MPPDVITMNSKVGVCVLFGSHQGDFGKNMGRQGLRRHKHQIEAVDDMDYGVIHFLPRAWSTAASA